MLGMVIQDRYEIRKSLGEDVLGAVYKGWDRKLNRNITIKVLNEKLEEELPFILDRVHFLYNLKHKNIIKFYDSGIDHKLPYIISEYIDGFTLREFMDKHQLKDPVTYTVQFCFQVCQALQYANRNYFFHGSIKPENILISNNGNIKLNNLGLANNEFYQTFSQSHQSDHYLSFEQLSGNDVDFRTDIYSLGVILYELLSGKSFCESYNDSMEKEQVPLRKFNDNIPKVLEAIVMKMIRKEREERFQNISDILSELYKIKYKTDKPLLEELFPDIDFSNFFTARETLIEKKRSDFQTRVLTSAKTTSLDKKSVDPLATRKIKLDFHVLDVMCKGSDIRYREARDALIHTGGDALKAIEVIAKTRKGMSPDAEPVEKKKTEEVKKEAGPGFFKSLNMAVSNLFTGFVMISKETKEEVIYFPAIILFSFLLIPLLLTAMPFLFIPLMIILAAGIFVFLYFNLQFDLLDRDTYDFKRKVALTLEHLNQGAPPVSAEGEIQDILTDVPGMASMIEVENVTEKKPPARKKRDKKEKDEEADTLNKEEPSPEASPVEEPGESPAAEEDEKKPARGRERAERRRERRKKKEDEVEVKEPEPVPIKEEKVDPDVEKIEYICSRLEGITPEEAREALQESGGDQVRAVTKLKRQKRKDRKPHTPPGEEPVAEKPAVKREEPPEEKAPEEPPEEKPPEEKPQDEKPAETPRKPGEFPQEKIDYICRRTKVTTEEAQKALEENDGDEIEAVMSIKKKKRRQRRSS